MPENENLVQGKLDLPDKAPIEPAKESVEPWVLVSRAQQAQVSPIVNRSPEPRIKKEPSEASGSYRISDQIAIERYEKKNKRKK